MNKAPNQNDATYLAVEIDGVKYFNGKKVLPSQMVWKCSVVNCSTPPKIQSRLKYKDIKICVKCSNALKAKNKEFLAKRGKAISKAIKEREGTEKSWSNVAKRNMSDIGTREKISISLKSFISENEEASLVRSKTAKTNNQKTGFGTSEFSKKLWSERTEEEKAEIREKSAQKQREESEKAHRILVNSRFPAYNVVEYKGDSDNKYRCPNGHLFSMRGGNFLQGRECQECSPRSKYENQIFDLVSTLTKKVYKNKRVLYLDDTLNGNNALEIDIYDPESQIGVEIHGLYYHTAAMVGKEKHELKAELSERHGILLLQFFEDEIIEKEPIVINMIKSKYGSLDRQIDASDCEVLEVSLEEARDFLNENHIEGSAAVAYSLGLYYENELVSLIAAGERDGNSIEIVRYCDKLGVHMYGSFSDLIDRSIEHFKSIGIERLFYLANRRFQESSPMLEAGFWYKGFTDLELFLFKKGRRELILNKTLDNLIESEDNLIYGTSKRIWFKDLK